MNLQPSLHAIRANVQRVLLGQPAAVDLALVCLLSEGHLLLQDVPGTGKTSLAGALAKSVGGSQRRLQFTPDLLPSDVTGSSVFNQATREFEFRPGPVFANVVIADEINRASPRTQSALLEVMEERRVSVDGVSHAVPRPFMVVATQNPVDMDGTFALPEAQLDRFLMRVSLGYPDDAAELAILSTHGAAGTSVLAGLGAVTDPRAVADMVHACDAVYASRALMEYVVQLVKGTRTADGVRLGVSPRGGLALLRACRANAVLAGRDYATADDVQAMALPVLSHRILLTPHAEIAGITAEQVITDLLESLATPEQAAA